jgi:TonB family protein
MSNIRLAVIGVTFWTVTLTSGPTLAAPQARVDVSALSAPPLKMITSVTPVYPPEAERLGIEANIELNVIVNAAGDVTSTEPGPSGGGGAMVHHDDQNLSERAEFVATKPRAFADAATAAARQWKFEPANAQWRCTFSFRFRAGSPDSSEAGEDAKLSIGSPAPSTPSGTARPGETASTPRTGPVRVGLGYLKPPQKMIDVKPLYPDEARAAKAKGVVLLEVTIAADGSVSKALVLRSIPMLDQAAIDAVTQWKFQPPLLNGAPVEVEMLIFVNFVPPSE